MMNYLLAPRYFVNQGDTRYASLFDHFFDAPVAHDERHSAYNLERVTDKEYRLSLAVTGFGEDQLSLESKGNELFIRGDSTQEDDSKLIYRGMRMKNFARHFQLADHVKVVNAELENGLLHITLIREIPESEKAQPIPIKAPDIKKR